MPGKNGNHSKPKGTKEWTLMFYFASDNPLAPEMVSQLKAIKQAGFHSEANVVVQFDPNAENAPVHVFDVNFVNKIRADGKHQIGFPLNPPLVRNLTEDKLWGKHEKKFIREALKKKLGNKIIHYAPPNTPGKMSGEQNPREALSAFLHFCRKHFPARNYMLFICGHGLILGNNLFLFDEHAKEHSLSLIELGVVLRGFKRKLEEQQAQFQLISFHSCSMGGLEVAYELQGTAKYMLATQGASFSGSWPYAQILIAIFNKIKKLVVAENGDAKQREGGSAVRVRERAVAVIDELVKEIWTYCYLNSYDFQLAGYSFDVCLCDLSKVNKIKRPLNELSLELIKALADPVARERILLAHWDAQSYWQDSYTDLYDFCYRLYQRCGDAATGYKKTGATLRSLQEKCHKVIRVLTSGDDNLVTRSDFTGPEYQYSHGLFVFFPWSEPGNRRFWLREYGSYKFSETSWREFLEQYFRNTRRRPRGYEDHSSKGGFKWKAGLDEILLEDVSGRHFNYDASLGKGGSMSTRQQRNSGVSSRRSPSSRNAGFWPFGPLDPEDPRGKPSPPLGDDSAYSSVKNYPSTTRGPIEKATSARKRRKRNKTS